MASLKELFEPRSDVEAVEFALEELVLSIQVALQKAMMKKGVSNKQLADRMGVSKARVSQILSDGPNNVTLKTVAKAAAALNEQFELVTREQAKEALAKRPYLEVLSAAPRLRDRKLAPWRDSTANENRFPDLTAA